MLINIGDGISEITAALGTDLRRDEEGSIVDDSDLGIAVRELERIDTVLSRLSFKLHREGIEAAPPLE
ncbi:hypothetical protein [Bradyrhizobium sp. Rc2d]|uniref:hypothetical protein n=1 Tax=Bradyrhizobium sp. Rc2d TaxID=1855321 RepID=UPI000B875A04|nr:hypothetical protein [Bradyrhizobium sp. Rc2d]